MRGSEAKTGSSLHAGTVYLVGAGPGDPDLITVRGMKILKKADVLVYDRLANPELLSWSSSHSEHIYVGKRPDKPSVSQNQINQILISKAREGKTVVRLKGGDPFVFGRGGEECEALVAAKVPYEVVPGISSALAAPAYAGIPITHRGVARSFTVVTGHICNHDSSDEHWEQIVHADTLVVLMGMKNLKRIIRQLICCGRSPDTPVAIIEKATWADQKTVNGTLETINGKANGFGPPAIIVIGKLAEQSRHLAWFDGSSSVSKMASGRNKTMTG